MCCLQRASRQTNGYDCGPFAAADLVSLLTSDAPSGKRQKEMVGWRKEMARLVRALEAEEFLPKPIKKLQAAKPKVSEDVLDLLSPPSTLR